MPLANGSYRDPIPLIQFLSSNGDGTGTTDAIGNYSVTPLTLYIQPDPEEVLVINELICHVSDSGKFLQGVYGSLASPLTNGIIIQVSDNSGIILPITNSHPIKSNDDYMHLTEMALQDFGGVADSLRASFTASHFGTELLLHGALNQKLEIIISDNCTGLDDHHFIVHGYR